MSANVAYLRVRTRLYRLPLRCSRTKIMPMP